MQATSAAQVVPSEARRFPSLAMDLAMARAKVREDLLRFRTCCADPRASK